MPATDPSRALGHHRSRRVGGVLGAAAILLGSLLGGVALPASAAGGPASLVGAGEPAGTTGPAGAAGTTTRSAPVVFIGVTGLRLDDVGVLTTPTLWSLTRDGSVGTVAVRSLRPSACPADGWLAVSAGARAGDVLDSTGKCRTLRLPSSSTGTVPGWSDFTKSAASSSFDAQLGLLGDTVTTAGLTATGIGPGAAIALADSTGRPVGDVSPLPSRTTDLSVRVREALETSDLLVVDLGSVRDPGQSTADRGADLAKPDADLGDSFGDGLLTGDSSDVTGPDAITDPTRASQVQAIDARLRAVLNATRLRSDATVVLVSIADSGRRPHLQLAAATGPSVIDGAAAYGGTLLASRSTRQPGYLQTTDITPTLLTALGARDDAPDGALVGTPVTSGAGPSLAGDRVAAMIDQDRHAQAVRPLTQKFYLGFVIVNLVLYLLVTIGLNARILERARRLVTGLVARLAPGRGRTTTRAPARIVGVLRSLRVLGVVVSTMPVASFLANLTPWWRYEHPASTVLALTGGWMLAMTAVALAPPWRRWALGPMGVVAGITTVVLAADIATGARLQISALMGVQPLVGARFYGFNNTAFALFAASTVLTATAIANPLLKRGRRGLAVTVIVVIGLAATVLDGLPGIGSDFGGPPALVPAFAVLALLAAGVRMSWKKAVAVLAGGAAVVIAFAVVDWLRPADSRTHLGRFVQTVLDGGLWPVVQRKAGQNLHNLAGSELTLLAVGGLVLVVVVLARPLRHAAQAPDGGAYNWLSSGAPLAQLGTDAPMFRPGLVALAIALGIGFLLNDSGVVIPAVGIGLAVPLLVAVCANWMLLLRPPAQTAPAASPV